MTTIQAKETSETIAAALSPGDDVMVHASLGRLGRFEPGVETIIDALFAAVGPQGTILMMTDTRSFATTGRFDIDQPSETGLLTEIFRKRSGVARSVVPMVSFAAQGARAGQYLQPYHSHLDATAPLTRLLENRGKVLLFGVGYEKCTLYHLSEERHATPGNFYKTFEGALVTGERVLAPISQRYFVRRDTSMKKDPHIAGQMLEERGQAMKFSLGDGTIRVFSACDFDNCCMDALAKDRHAFIYSSVPRLT
ncbi:MAG: AAC(3) family N-acetyltransferase [Marinibacterium sp.]|nr:AAC(3) family N-acetyltransferase [Marinibacterium sp.]